MNEKYKLLKELGFSDQLIDAIKETEFDELKYSYISESTSFLEPTNLFPNDLNKIIIDKTNKPQSLIINSVKK